MELSRTFVDFAQLGADWVLWLLVGLSVFSVGIMVDRFLWFRRRDTDTDKFVREMRGAYQRDELDQLAKKYEHDPAIPIQVALRGLEDRTHGAAAVAESMHGERARWRRAADRNLIVLGTLGNNVPFVGLFGTVLGIIRAFHDLAGSSIQNTQAVMTGIAEALVATGVGLLVALPAVAMYNACMRHTETAAASADAYAHEILAHLRAEPTTEPTAAVAAARAKEA